MQKKFLAWLLTFCMVLSLVPVSLSANTTQEGGDTLEVGDVIDIYAGDWSGAETQTYLPILMRGEIKGINGSNGVVFYEKDSSNEALAVFDESVSIDVKIKIRNNTPFAGYPSNKTVVSTPTGVTFTYGASQDSAKEFVTTDKNKFPTGVTTATVNGEQKDILEIKEGYPRKMDGQKTTMDGTFKVIKNTMTYATLKGNTSGAKVTAFVGNYKLDGNGNPTTSKLWEGNLFNDYPEIFEKADYSTADGILRAGVGLVGMGARGVTHNEAYAAYDLAGYEVVKNYTINGEKKSAVIYAWGDYSDNNWDATKTGNYYGSLTEEVYVPAQNNGTSYVLGETLAPGAYKLSGKFKTDAGEVALSVLGGEAVTVTADNKATSEFVFVVGKDAAVDEIVLEWMGDGAEKLYFDDITLTYMGEMYDGTLYEVNDFNGAANATKAANEYIRFGQVTYNYGTRTLTLLNENYEIGTTYRIDFDVRVDSNADFTLRRYYSGFNAAGAVTTVEIPAQPILTKRDRWTSLSITFTPAHASPVQFSVSGQNFRDARAVDLDNIVLSVVTAVENSKYADGQILFSSNEADYNKNYYCDWNDLPKVASVTANNFQIQSEAAGVYGSDNSAADKNDVTNALTIDIGAYFAAGTYSVNGKVRADKNIHNRTVYSWAAANASLRNTLRDYNGVILSANVLLENGVTVSATVTSNISAETKKAFSFGYYTADLTATPYAWEDFDITFTLEDDAKVAGIELVGNGYEIIADSSVVYRGNTGNQTYVCNINPAYVGKNSAITDTITENDIKLNNTAATGFEVRDITIAAFCNHVEGEAEVENEVDATCKASGSYDNVVYCTECGLELSRTEVRVAKTAHIWDEGVETLAPTEEAEGVMTYTCEACGATKTEVIPKIEPSCKHENTTTTETVTLAPTCTAAGSKTVTVTCECGEVISTETVAIPATGHAYNDGVVTTAPDCDEAGIKTYTCGNCKETKTEAVEALGHDWADADCDTPKTCATCGATEGEALGHDWTDADCDTPKTCATCGATEGEALGHAYNDGVVTTEPTLNAEGVKTFTCANCGHTYTEAIDKLTGGAAEINGYIYATLAEALAAANAGETVTLLADVTASQIIIINKAITLDGNGKTITSTAARAINVEVAGNVIIKNVIINAGERAINIINQPANVTVENVTATAANNAIMMATSAAGANLTVNGSDLTGLAVINVASAASVVVINNTTIDCVDANAEENYGAITVYNTATNANVTVNGGEITVADDSKAAYVFAPTANVTLNGVACDNNVGAVVAMIGDAGFDTLAEAIADAKAGQTIELVRDVALTETLTVAKDVTLDLNGNTISGDFAGTFGIIYVKNGATLTINGDGAIRATAGDAIGNYGTVIVNGGDITTDAGTYYGAIYNYCYAADYYGTTVINGGNVGSVLNCGIITVNGGNVAYLDNSGKLAVEGGAIAEIIAKDGSDSLVADAGIIEIADPSIITVGDDYKLVEIADGTYKVVAKDYVAQVGDAKFETFAAAIEAAEAGDTVTLLADVALTETLTVAKDVTLDLNGNTISGNFVDAYGMIYVKKGAALTVEGEGAITSTATHAIGNYGTVTVNGGDITTAAGEEYGAIYNFCYAADFYGTTVINGGNVGSLLNCGVLTVNDGNVAYLDNSGKLAVVGGTVTKIIAKDGTDSLVADAGTIAIENTKAIVLPEGYDLVEVETGVYKVVDHKLNHTAGAVVVENEVAATCTGDGSYDNVVYCTVCKAELDRDTVVVPATGHDYEEVVTAPTCVAEGYTTYTCKNDATHTYVDNKVPATGNHNYVNGKCDVCGAEEPVELFSIAFANMSLKNSMAMNFAFAKAGADNWDGHYAEIVKKYADGRADVVQTLSFDENEWVSTTISGVAHYYVTFSGIAAKEMSDNIYVTIYNANGEAVSETWVDSVRAYAHRTLDNPATTKADKILMVDMLNYGAAAQDSFDDYGMDDLANKNLTDEQKALATQETPEYDDNRVKGDNYLGSSLLLKENIRLLMAFKNVDETMTATVKFTNHYGDAIAKTVAIVDGASYGASGSKVVVIDSLVVADARQDVTVEITDASGNVVAYATDSVESYAAREAVNGDPLYDYIMKFADAAYASFH